MTDTEFQLIVQFDEDRLKLRKEIRELKQKLKEVQRTPSPWTVKRVLEATGKYETDTADGGFQLHHETKRVCKRLKREKKHGRNWLLGSR